MVLRPNRRFFCPPSFGDTQTESPESEDPSGSATDAALAELDIDLPFKDAKARLVDAFERAYWSRLLERTKGNVSAAARIAGIHRKSAEYLLKKLDLRDG